MKSPAELLNNRKFRTTLPMFKRVSVSDTTSKTKEELYQRQKLQAFYYNKTAGPTLQPFQPGQSINIYDHHTKRWERGTVIRPAKEPRSFLIKNDRTEGVYRRTRSQLKPRPEVKDDSIKEPPPTTPETAASQDNSATPPQDGKAYTTRSGRTSKTSRQTRRLIPEHLNYFEHNRWRLVMNTIISYAYYSLYNRYSLFCLKEGRCNGI